MAQKIHLPQIGDHYKIIAFEKNENSQNILVVYTKLDTQCHFVRENGRPLIDFYWLMDGQRFKPTHRLIKQAVRQRLELSSDSKDPQSFRLKINDLKELNTNLHDPHLIVRVEETSSGCRVLSYFPAEDKNKSLIQVHSLYSESKKTLLPPFRKLLAVTVRGEMSGKTIEKRYVAR